MGLGHLIQLLRDEKVVVPHGVLRWESFWHLKLNLIVFSWSGNTIFGDVAAYHHYYCSGYSVGQIDFYVLT